MYLWLFGSLNFLNLGLLLCRFVVDCNWTVHGHIHHNHHHKSFHGMGIGNVTKINKNRHSNDTIKKDKKKQNTKSSKPELTQHDIEKYLNMHQEPADVDSHHSSAKTTIVHNNIHSSSSSGSSETDEMAPLRDNTLITQQIHNTLSLPQRSTTAVSSSLQVSRATSIIEDSYPDGMI